MWINLDQPNIENLISRITAATEYSDELNREAVIALMNVDNIKAGNGHLTQPLVEDLPKLLLSLDAIWPLIPNGCSPNILGEHYAELDPHSGPHFGSSFSPAAALTIACLRAEFFPHEERNQDTFGIRVIGQDYNVSYVDSPAEFLGTNYWKSKRDSWLFSAIIVIGVIVLASYFILQ